MIDHIADQRFSNCFIFQSSYMVSFDMIDSDEVYLRRGECWVVDIVRMITDPCVKSRCVKSHIGY